MLYLKTSIHFLSMLPSSCYNVKCFRHVVEKIKTHFMFNNFLPEHRAVCEIICKNIVERDS